MVRRRCWRDRWHRPAPRIAQRHACKCAAHRCEALWMSLLEPAAVPSSETSIPRGMP
ncbi:hypothetical protein JOD64_000218 [Micromonospora luteifusca]|uniref:SWIM-type domain-containing protein n=1 Tax=Micromonospora luteifusca TaxID=709860 RepID=A0ABS2LLD4_9ACTN|nr:hypothetical protein [Micromonospora luteifusca]